jgi:hypothetical protein
MRQAFEIVPTAWQNGQETTGIKQRPFRRVP